MIGSDLWVFFAFWGILPDTYRAAPPLPGLTAGNLLAMTVVPLWTIAVSSSYSTVELVSRKNHLINVLKGVTTIRTFAAIFGGDYKLEVRAVTKLTDRDDFSFQFEH